MGLAMNLLSAPFGIKLHRNLTAGKTFTSMIVLGIVAPLMAVTGSNAQTAPITIAPNQQVEWADNFDIATDHITEVKSSAPTLSPQTADYIAAAINRYQSIVQAGGWGTVRLQTHKIAVQIS